MRQLILDSAVVEQVLQVLANVEGPPSVVAEAEQAEVALRAALSAQPATAVAQVCSIHYGGKPPAAATIEILCESADYHDLPIREGDLLYRHPQRPRRPMTKDMLRAEFAKVYPNDAGLLELAENNRDFMLESIGARHHWSAFERGARAVERAHEIKEGT